MKFFGASALLLASALLPAFTEESPKNRITLIGTAETVYGDTILVKTRGNFVILYADAKTSVWYGKEYHDFARIKAGDRVSGDAETLPDGRLRAVRVWVNYSSFGAVIVSVRNDAYEVLTNFDADTYSGYRKEKKLLKIGTDTFFESGSKGDLKVGRVVWVVGLDRENSVVQATRIEVVGIDDRSGKVLPITGPPN